MKARTEKFERVASMPTIDLTDAEHVALATLIPRAIVTRPLSPSAANNSSTAVQSRVDRNLVLN
jgi:hypothetical protein